MLVVTCPVIPSRSSTDRRSHPWGKTAYEEDGGAYYSFIERPELIREVLEDYRPHAERPAIQKFYELLEWINRPDGNLETNDCALRPPVPESDLFRKTHRIGGRLELFMRNHAANTVAYENAFLWMARMLAMYLQVEGPDCRTVIFDFSVKPTDYILLPEDKCAGYRLSITFNAYGDGDDEVWGSLLTAFEALLEATKRLDRSFGGQIPELP